jgi:putative nucleotidyltransferase with HDIG domain
MAVVMLSGVREAETAVECLLAGALDYITKPALLGEVRSRIQRALEKRDLLLQNRFYHQNLERLVDQQADRLKELFLEGVQTLVQALDAKDPYTRGHSSRVSHYALKIAERMGFTGQAVEDVRLGAELHDIGKIGTREAVLRKPGPLTADEFTHITEHTVLGERILAPLSRANPTVLSIVRSHHERVDGAGFPDHLQGNRIPWAARIVAVADAFDAMTTDRSYRTSLLPATAFEELKSCSGSHFDKDVVDAFRAEFPDPSQLLVGR